jgi:predicted Rossmann-fold nucleotide-binding protein
MDFLVHQQFGLIEKKIILINILGYWDPLLEQFKKMVRMNTLQQKHLDQLTVVSSVEEYLKIISDTEASSNKTGLDNYYWEEKNK